MKPTNATVTFKRLTTDWQGQETVTEIGSYNVFVEHSTKLAWEFQTIGGVKDPSIMQRGYIYLYDDVDVKEGDTVTIDGTDYVIVSVDRYESVYSGFHHIELRYK